MQNIQQEPQSQTDAEAADVLGAEIADTADTAAAAEAAKDELVQETQAAQAAEALTAAVAKQEEYLAMAQRVQADFD
ncbi:MAG: hypothetical protein RR431_03180, partial [Clostridia bacterium]